VWRERFHEHNQLVNFITTTFPLANSAHGRVLFAWGAEPEIEKIGRFTTATRYLVYPANMFTHTSGEFNRLAHIAVYQTKEDLFDALPFCRAAGDKNYLCDVKPTEGGDKRVRLDVRYNHSILILHAWAMDPRQPNPSLLILSLYFDPAPLPVRKGFDVTYNFVLTGSCMAGDRLTQEGGYWVRLPMEPGVLPFIRFRLLAVDAAGNIFRSNEVRVESAGESALSLHKIRS
jgi:hypothetical protein